MSNNVVFVGKKKVCCLSSVCHADAVRNVSRYILPYYQRLWCIALNYTGSVGFAVRMDPHTIAPCLSACLLPLLTARLCDSHPLHPIVPILWHLGGGMMQWQPWRWTQLWCNAVMQQQGYFRSTSEPPRPPSASMPPCPSLSQHLICHEPDSHTWTSIHRIY